ncbi:thioesterase-like superfamily-domain-containing protein [Mycena sanguinolenta]|nr:thioesterase-like superfamily-domain-containing protein [Mycena sanguinolenta]
MAPLTKATHVTLALADDSPGNPHVCYTAKADPEWVIGRVPNGGYVLGLIVQACIEHQAGSEHPDPLHASAHYLQPTKTSALEVHIRVLKRGRSFINVLADLVQGNRPCITAHLIFGKIPASTGPLIDLSSGYARRLPYLRHPSEAVLEPMPSITGFAHRVRWAPDLDISARNGADSAARHVPTGGGIAVWGAWVELVDEDERLTPASLAFIADCTETMASLYPGSVTGAGNRTLWRPTLTLSLEWKAPIPPPSEMHSARTVGMYVMSGFMSEPQNRHNTAVEIWTAPCNIGEGAPMDRWRDKQVCLAVASQMQLMVDPSVNERVGTKL